MTSEGWHLLLYRKWHSRSAASHSVMSSMTGTVRNIPTLAVAPTQNTAPVFEFRCLYTHDLRKKRKIWHDGSLRFHTFNRRIMVYDDSKNYIGDAHWRDTSEFQEGEELRLDKGVMVEVGEQIGHTETDLAPIILEKRRPKTASSPLRIPLQSNTYSSGPLPAGSSAQARPKSLAAVIGASQGLIGRARLPARSPFELRQDNVEPQPKTCGDRPAKRPKTAPEKENMVQYPNPVKQFRLPTPQGLETITTNANLPCQGKRVFLGVDRTLETSVGLSVRSPSAPRQFGKNEKDGGEHQSVSVAETRPPPRRSVCPSMARSVRDAPRDRISHVTSSDQTCKQKDYADDRYVQVVNMNQAKTAAPKSAASTCSAENKVMNKLRFAKEKPRKKLMYRDLLRRVRHEKPTPTNNSGDVRKRGQRNEAQLPDNPRSPESLPREGVIIDLLSEMDEDLPLAVQTPVHIDCGRVYPKCPSPPGYAPPSASPLFLDQQAHSPGFTPFQPSFDDHDVDDGDDFEPPVRSQSPGHERVAARRINVPPKSQRDPVEDMAGLEVTRAANREGVKISSVSEAPSELIHLDQQLLRKAATTEYPPPRNASQPTLKQRSLRRIRSEGDSYVHRPTEHLPTNNLSETGDSMAACVRQGPNQADKPFRSPTEMQRSVSDVTHLAQRTEAPARRAPIRAVAEAGFEPWSEYEAYLLFDWWPPRRAKPSFAVSGSG